MSNNMDLNYRDPEAAQEDLMSFLRDTCNDAEEAHMVLVFTLLICPADLLEDFRQRAVLPVFDRFCAGLVEEVLGWNQTDVS